MPEDRGGEPWDNTLPKVETVTVTKALFSVGHTTSAPVQAGKLPVPICECSICVVETYFVQVFILPAARVKNMISSLTPNCIFFFFKVELILVGFALQKLKANREATL